MLAAASTSAHVCTSITFEVDADKLPHYTDQHLAALWHIAQANPAPYGDRAACDFAERVGREIIRRFLAQTGPELWNHQGRHVDTLARTLRNIEDAMNKHLREAVQPGSSVTAEQVLEELGLALSATNESALRSAFTRAGFRPTRSTGGSRTWTAPPADPPADHDGHHQALHTQASRPLASHRQARYGDHPLQESQPQAEQPAQTASHQCGLGSSSADPFDPSGSSETPSLVAAGGAAA